MSHDIVLSIRQLSKQFGSHTVLKGIDLDVRQGEKIAIIGGSGSGKSTLLRCLNFMEYPTGGTITFNGQVLGEEKPVAGVPGRVYRESSLCAVREKIGMVFQQFNLFPHMTVLQNVMEGLTTVRRKNRAVARQTAISQLTRVGLAEKLNAFPSQLSGGQQQRVAIARALAIEPEILLFDEPTSSLDPELVGEVLKAIHELADEGRTLLLVTHELGFAYHFADRVIFIDNGQIHETGTPDEILKNPQSERTRAFLARFAERAF